MSFRRFAHLLLAAPVAFVVFAAARPASAAGISLLMPVQRTIAPNHQDNINTAYWISRADCLAGDAFRFTLNIADAAGANLEVWVGEGSSDCTQKINRDTGSAVCLQVFSGPPTPTPQTITIPAQDIVRVQTAKGPGGQGMGTPDVCDNSTTGATADQVTIFFMLIASTEQIANVTWANTSIDLLGPAPPTDVVVQGGSTFLGATWSAATDPDRTGFVFFCDPPPNGLPEGGIDAGPAVCVGGSTPVSTDAGDAGDAGDGSTGGGSTCTDASSTGNCGGFNFVPGALPSLAILQNYSCGPTPGQNDTNAAIESVSLAQTTAVAMASIDKVSNVGPLSNVACGKPEPVNGFNDLYHAAGGTGGGGFCSFRLLPTRRGAAAWTGISLAMLGIWAARRRSVKRQSGSGF